MFKKRLRYSRARALPNMARFESRQVFFFCHLFRLLDRFPKLGKIAYVSSVCDVRELRLAKDILRLIFLVVMVLRTGILEVSSRRRAPCDRYQQQRQYLPPRSFRKPQFTLTVHTLESTFKATCQNSQIRLVQDDSRVRSVFPSVSTFYHIGVPSFGAENSICTI